MTAPDLELMRTHLHDLLSSVTDFGAVSTGDLRDELEVRLGLAPGGLLNHKRQVKELIKEVYVQIQAEEQEDSMPLVPAPAPVERPKVSQAEVKEPAGKKRKTAAKPATAATKSAAAATKPAAVPAHKALPPKEDTKEEPDAALEKPNAEPSLAASAPPSVPASLPEPKPEEYFGDGTLEGEVPPTTSPHSKLPLEPASSPKKRKPPTLHTGLDIVRSPPPKPKGKRQLLTASLDSHLKLWDWDSASSSATLTLQGHKTPIRALVVDWDRMEVLTGADDCAKLWCLKQGGCLRTFNSSPTGVGALAGDWPRQKVVAGCSDGSLKIWHMTRGEQLQMVPAAHSGGVWTMAANFGAQQAVTGGEDQLKVWDTSSWSCVTELPLKPGIMCLQVDWADLRALVGFACKAENLELWDLQRKELMMSFNGHTDVVAAVAVNWERNTAISGGWDAQLLMWSLDSSVPTSHTCPFGRVRSLAADFTEGQVLCGASNGQTFALDVRTWSITKTFLGHLAPVLAVQARV